MELEAPRFETPADAFAWLQQVNFEHRKYQLTRRDRFAAAALTGMLASWPEGGTVDPDKTAEVAVKFADALIAALDAPRAG